MRPDIKEIVSSTRDYNFHSHTQFCDGRETMAVMAAEAVAQGMKHYGFTPHSPICVESSCNMASTDVEAYRKEFLRLKEMYKDVINLYFSMEIDFLGDKWGATHPFFKDIPLDYRLSSIHFVESPLTGEEIDIDGSPQGFAVKMAKYFDGDIRYVVDSFYARTLEMIEKGGFDIIGHFDKIGYNASTFSPGIEDEVWYRQHICDVIDALSGSGIVAEINTKAVLPPVGATPEKVAAYVPRLFPSPESIRMLVRAGIPVVVNSDAHYSSRIRAGRDFAFSIIDSIAE